MWFCDEYCFFLVLFQTSTNGWASNMSYNQLMSVPVNFSLQENLIGALLAIFGHLVVSIALNLQVSSLTSRLRQKYKIGRYMNCQLPVACVYSIFVGISVVPVGCSRLSLDALPSLVPMLTFSFGLLLQYPPVVAYLVVSSYLIYLPHIPPTLLFFGKLSQYYFLAFLVTACFYIPHLTFSIDG